jgi:hypothetical protein
VFATNDFRAHLGEVTFISRRNFVKKMSGDYRTNMASPRNLPLIIDRVAFSSTLLAERCVNAFVKIKVVRLKAQYFVISLKKNPVLIGTGWF